MIQNYGDRMMKFFSLFSSLLLLALSLSGAEVRLLTMPDKVGWVFRPDEAIVFQLEPTSANGDEVLRITLRDYYGTEHIAKDLSAQDRSEDGYFRLSPLPNGFYTMRLSGAGIDLEQPLAVIPEPPEETRLDSNPFGVNFHFTRIPVADAERELLMAREIGIKWGRGVLFDWAESEPDFAVSHEKYRELIEMLARHDMSYLGGVYFTPSWASSAPKDSEYIVWSRVMPEQQPPEQLTEFCRNLARSAPFVKYWEVGNECDLEGMWKGRWQHFVDRNQDAIIRDYVDFLRSAAQGFREGNPDAKILYNGIATLDGGSYPGFFRRSLEAGAAPWFDIMNIHYKVSLPETRALLTRFDKSDIPVWVTELGGYAVGSQTKNGDVEQIVQDIDMSVRQLANGAAHVFKYDLRNDWESQNDIEANFGLIRRDFSPKPAYVAYATLIRLLIGADFVRELNVISQSDQGWLKAYAFHNPRLKRNVNVMMLNAVENAVVTLKTPDNAVTLVDATGSEKELPARDGQVTFQVGELPFFVIGEITDNPGEIVYPQDQMTKSLIYPLNNPGFEEPFTGPRDIPHWDSLLDPSCMSVLESAAPHEGNHALRVTIQKGVDIFSGIGQMVDITPYMINLGADEYLQLKASCEIKRDALVGRGAAFSISFYGRDGNRLSWRETLYEPGTHDWRRDTLVIDRIPDGTVKIRIEFWTAPMVTGSYELDDMSLEIQTWERPARRR